MFDKMEYLVYLFIPYIKNAQNGKFSKAKK